MPARGAAAVEPLDLGVRADQLREVELLGRALAGEVQVLERRVLARDVAVPREVRAHLPAEALARLVAEMAHEREPRLRALRVVAASEEPGAADLAADAAAAGKRPLGGDGIRRLGAGHTGAEKQQQGHDARRASVRVHAWEAPRMAEDRAG